MRLLQRTLLILSIGCGTSWATFAREDAGSGAAEIDLSTREARRRYVLESAVDFADNLDRISSQRIAGGDLEQGLKIKEHADLVRLGFQLPTETSQVDGLAVDSELEAALADFLEARSRAIEECDAAKRRATDQGEVFLIQQLTAERNALRADTARDLGAWDTDPDAWKEGRGGRIAHQVPRVFPLDSNSIPDELNVRFGPQRFGISGRSRHDTFRYRGRLIGHMGKIGIIDRELIENEPLLQGVFRTRHSRIAGGTQHFVAFVQGNRVVDNAQFTAVIGQTYDWRAELKDGEINCTITDGSRILVNRTVSAATLTRIGFGVSVRQPPQEASSYVAWK